MSDNINTELRIVECEHVKWIKLAHDMIQR
jgi:hypothetical protein